MAVIGFLNPVGLWGTWYYAQMLSNFDAMRQTTSELGTFGTPLVNQGNYGLFLPVGLMQWLALACQYRMLNKNPVYEA